MKLVCFLATGRNGLKRTNEDEVEEDFEMQIATNEWLCWSMHCKRKAAIGDIPRSKYSTIIVSVLMVAMMSFCAD